MGAVRVRDESFNTSFTLIEGLNAIGIQGVLFANGVVAFRDCLEASCFNIGIKQLVEKLNASHDHELVFNSFRDSLGGIEQNGIIGGLGNPCQFLNITEGKVRKVHNLVSFNTDYDLNSMEPDGKWVSPLTAKASRDDIIHVNDGSHIGPAANYSCRGLL